MASLKPFIRDLNGKILRVEDLPKQNTDRWGRRQKATLLLAIRGGVISYEEAEARYALTQDELTQWAHAFDLYGLAGLRISNMQKRFGSKYRRI